nr:MAG TPA: tail tube protein [Bacteriophage sp.]
MAKLTWATPNPKYQYGVSHGVLYNRRTGIVAPWDGLVDATESFGEPVTNEIYLNGQKVGETNHGGEYTAEISAYSFPFSFRDCLGIQEIFKGFVATQQAQQEFCCSYETKVGEDKSILHILYNCKASISGVNYTTINQTVDPILRKYKLTLRPIVDAKGIEGSSHISIDQSWQPALYERVTNLLYGSANNDPTLILPNDIKDLFKELNL